MIGGRRVHRGTGPVIPLRKRIRLGLVLGAIGATLFSVLAFLGWLGHALLPSQRPGPDLPRFLVLYWAALPLAGAIAGALGGKVTSSIRAALLGWICGVPFGVGLLCMASSGDPLPAGQFVAGSVLLAAGFGMPVAVAMFRRLSRRRSVGKTHHGP